MGTETELVGSLKFAMGASREFRWPAPKGRAMNRIGERLGHELARSITARGFGEAVEELSHLWADNGLGLIQLSGTNNQVLQITKCYDCAGWKIGLSDVACNFKGSLLAAALTNALHEEVRLTEFTCCRTGAKSCSFTIERTMRP
jgi:predicted hydrocarbon binding protein